MKEIKYFKNHTPNSTTIGKNGIIETFNILLKCIKGIKFSYVHANWMSEYCSVTDLELFEHQQGLLENHTQELSKSIHIYIDNLSTDTNTLLFLQREANICKNFLDNLVTDAELCKYTRYPEDSMEIGKPIQQDPSSLKVKLIKIYLYINLVILKIIIYFYRGHFIVNMKIVVKPLKVIMKKFVHV
jgi:hypothetical protein